MCPYVAPHTAKIHTLITLGISIHIKPLVLKALKRPPCGFDSHRPLHFLWSDVSPRCPRTRLSSSSSSDATFVPSIEFVDCPLGQVRSRWSHPSVIGPIAGTGERQVMGSTGVLLRRPSPSVAVTTVTPCLSRDGAATRSVLRAQTR
jgi:hypothetical protein